MQTLRSMVCMCFYTCMHMLRWMFAQRGGASYPQLSHTSLQLRDSPCILTAAALLTLGRDRSLALQGLMLPAQRLVRCADGAPLHLLRQHTLNFLCDTPLLWSPQEQCVTSLSGLVKQFSP